MKKAISFLLALFMIFALCACSSTDYKKAKGLYGEGNYEEAKALFETLGDYRDSKDYIIKCEEELKRQIAESTYSEAVSLFSNAKYEEAKALFESLGDYSDASTYIEKCDIEIKYAEKNETNESDFRESCYSLDSDINYDELLRYPEKYKGIHIAFFGKVSDQPNENYSEKVAWCETKKVKLYGYYDFSGNKAEITYKEDANEGRIIRNDYVRFYGVFEGLTSFHSMGGTYDVPVFTVYYYSIIPSSWLKIY